MAKKILKKDLLENIPADRKAQFAKWIAIPYQIQCEHAKKAKAGDIWINPQTGRTVTINANTWRGLTLTHELGRVTTKDHHYFAGDYYPAVLADLSTPTP